mgnify:FL=1
MGAWDFYVNLKIDASDAYALLAAYKNNALYQNAFHYGIAQNSAADEYNAGITSVIDSFLPANILIFSFITENLNKKSDFQIKTLDIERDFDFEKKVDFINFMYNAWEEKIDAYYKLFGGVLLNHNDYVKARSKLYRKYYIKF